MPTIDDGFVPDSVKGKHHLAVVGQNGTAIAIPIGSVILYVMDPYLATGAIPMVLTKLSRKQWDFACACGKSGCTLTYQAKIRHEGHHPLPDALATEK